MVWEWAGRWWLHQFSCMLLFVVYDTHMCCCTKSQYFYVFNSYTIHLPIWPSAVISFCYFANGPRTLTLSSLEFLTFVWTLWIAWHGFQSNNSTYSDERKKICGQMKKTEGEKRKKREYTTALNTIAVCLCNITTIHFIA